MKQTLIVFSVLMLVSIHTYCQDVQKYHETYRSTTVTKTPAQDTRDYYTNYQNSLLEEFDGTYQFIINGTDKISITSEVKEFISSNRSKKDEVLISITPGVKLRILSERFIKSKKFSPFKEMFVFE